MAREPHFTRAMKQFLIALTVSALLLAPTVSRAQPYNAAHKLQAALFGDVKMPTFARGKEMDKAEVMAVQYLLRNRGVYKSRVDGVFGDVTAAAVKKFQRTKGLKVDGIIGGQTWPSLLLRLKQGDRGDAVRALQILLRNVVGHDGETPFIGQEVDGVFGASTRRNVLEYQRDAIMTNLSLKNDLKADGIVGERTWAALLLADFGGG